MLGILGLDVSLSNATSSRTSFHYWDFRANISGNIHINPDVLRTVRNADFLDRDIPGGFLRQELDADIGSA